jgi:SulP family sulfate permease
MFNNLKQNWKSGVTVSLVSIPLSVSLAIAAGSTPVAGIITAIWAGLFAAIFGGSNFNIVGPTGALSGILATYAFINGAQSLAVLAIATGVVVILSWVLRLERYLVFIPANTIQGFTLGVAFIIGMNQTNFALGYPKLPGHEKFIDNILESLRHIDKISFESLIVFVLFFLGIFITEKFRSRIKIIASLPATVIFAFIGILLGYASSTNALPFTLQTLGSRYSDLSAQLFIFPNLTVPYNWNFIATALTVALIAIIETMLSARIADSMTKTKHNKRKEMLGLGIANLASGIAGGIPATAALARTSLNIKSGATNKTSGIVNAIAIILISFFLLPYFKFLPLTVIAAILVTVAVRMIEKEHLVRMYRIDKKSFWIAMVVAFITVYEDPIMGILVGAAISMFLFLENLSRGQFEVIANDANKKMIGRVISSKAEDFIKDSHTVVYSIKGHFTYIDSQEHVSRFETEHDHHKNIILRMRELYFIDLDGVDAFEEIIEILEKRGINVYITGVSNMILPLLQKSKHYKKLEKENRIFPRTSDALRELGFKL